MGHASLALGSAASKGMGGHNATRLGYIDRICFNWLSFRWELCACGATHAPTMMRKGGCAYGQQLHRRTSARGSSGNGEESRLLQRAAAAAAEQLRQPPFLTRRACRFSRGEVQMADWPMLSRLLMVIAAIGFVFESACGATIELTGYSVGRKTLGVKIEGEIEPGDALKLLTLYEYFGHFTTENVFLWSRGGDVEEAMLVGRLIRRLRLDTIAPSRGKFDVLTLFGAHATPANKENNVCASVCVLIYAGGANRTGDLLILHRPYPTPETASKLSDVEFELEEKKAIAKVRDYLQEMEFPQYYIDKLVATFSQDGYFPTDKELDEHPLAAIPPSLEEIILSRCEVLSSAEEKFLFDNADQIGKARAKNKSLVDRLAARWQASFECETEQLNGLRLAAWNRENEAPIDDKCDVNGIGQSEIDKCVANALEQFTVETIARGDNAKPGDTPPPDFSVDPSILNTP